MSAWTIAWIIWIIVGVGIEVAALANDVKNDTLSEHVWMLYSSPFGKFIAWMLTAFFVWMTIHFLTRGKV